MRNEGTFAMRQQQAKPMLERQGVSRRNIDINNRCTVRDRE
jgi:hypothetical protein